VYILAGGKSSRFGQDKARAQWKSESLIERVARLCEPWASHVWAVVSPEQDYSDLGIECINDEVAHQGPLGGITRALTHACERQQQWIAVVACDLVELRPQWIDALRLHACAPNKAVAYKDTHWHPLCALYNVNALEDARKELILGGRRVHTFLDMICAVGLEPPQEGFTTAGVNTPQALAAHLRRDQ
jgi:molybdopterin-guanine dinucleotide biosynthesis protein A